MKIDQALNLVTTIDQGDSPYPIYVYVTPFPVAVVEQYHEILGATLSKFYNLIGDLGAVRTAAMMLRKAEKTFYPNGYDGPGFFDEIIRLTQVAQFKDGKWKKIPLESALNSGVITDDEWRDVEGEVCFFIVSSAMQKRTLLAPLTGRALRPFGALLTPLSVTAYLDSLPKQKQAQVSDTAPDTDAVEGETPAAKTISILS